MPRDPSSAVSGLAAGGAEGRSARVDRFGRAFTAGDRATRAVLADLVAAMSGAGVAADDLWNLELVLAEALNNVTEHAYGGGAGPVELEVVRRADGFVCRIADRGRPMPGDDPPDPPLPVIAPPDILPEGGFGWHIIRCLARDLRYRRGTKGNTLTMVLPLAGTSRRA